jgi:hypothetical protein
MWQVSCRLAEPLRIPIPRTSVYGKALSPELGLRALRLVEVLKKTLFWRRAGIRNWCITMPNIHTADPNSQESLDF